MITEHRPWVHGWADLLMRRRPDGTGGPRSGSRFRARSRRRHLSHIVLRVRLGSTPVSRAQTESPTGRLARILLEWTCGGLGLRLEQMHGSVPKKSSPGRAEVYIKRVNEFLHLLGVSIHLLSTRPLRGQGQALTLTKFRNTTLGNITDCLAPFHCRRLLHGDWWYPWWSAACLLRDIGLPSLFDALLLPRT